MSKHDSPKDNDQPPGEQSMVDLESLSLAYSEQLSMGGVANVEQILAQVPKEQRAAFLDRLNSMAADFATPGQKQKPPSREETFSESRDQSFVDSASMTATGALGTVGEEASPRSPKQLGDYILESEIGRGGMGIVYRARHAEREDVVALKILPSVDGESLHRFKREFRSLADISHPNLVGLHSLESADGQWFFTMDLIEGARSFRQFVAPNKVLNLDRLKSAMLQFVEGVSKLHELDVIHRDLKPSNVVVSQNGQLVILDFGLVSELKRRDDTLTVQSVSGTPAYMSPEAAAAEQETAASDWYAVGVMLYQSLCGRLPFDGESLQILSDKRTQDAPPLLAGEGLPAEICQLCMRMLSRNPQARPVYEEIRSTFGGASSNIAAVASDSEFLLGRDWHLSALHTAHRKTREIQSPIVAFVSGQSGEGKSCLVRKFLSEVRDREEVTVLSGRCYDRESVPFKALDSLIDALASYLRTMDVAEAAILLPDDTGFLASLFPVLTRVKVIADRPTPAVAKLDQQQIRKRAFAALRVLLQRLSTSIRLVMFCDDLQWGDADSAEALVDVLSGDDPPELLFIGSYRSDERETSPFLHAWDQFLDPEQNLRRHGVQEAKRVIESVDIEVGPLTLEHCREMVANLSGGGRHAVERLAEEIFHESNGNAFFLSELLECIDIVGRGLNRRPLNELIANKLSQLPSSASDLLQTLAVGGHALRESELVAAAGNSADAQSMLIKMQALKLVRNVGELDEDKLLDTYHDKIRESTYEALGSSVQRRRHLALFQTIEAVPDASELRAFDLAYHADQAGERGSAKKYALLAAAHANNQQSARIAVEQYMVAYRNSDSGLSQPGSFEFAEGFANALVLIGDYSRAVEFLTESKGCTQVATEIGRLHELEAAATFRNGDAIGGAEITSKSLAALGIRVPRHMLGFLVSISALVAWQATIGRVLRLLPSRKATHERVQILSLLCQLAFAGGFSHGLTMLWATLKGMALSNRNRKESAYARFCTYFCAILAVMSTQRLSTRYGKLGLANRRQANDQLGIGESLCWLGIATWAAGEYEKAIELLSESIDALNKLGDEWTVNLAGFHRSMALFRLGHLDKAIVEANWVFDRCRLTGDPRSACSAYALLRASDGLANAYDLASTRKPTPNDFLATCNMEKGLALWHARNERFGDALKSASMACRLPVQQRLPNYHSFASASVALNVLIRYLKKLDTNSEEYRRVMKKTKSLAWKASCLARICPSEASCIWREIGQLNELHGKHSKARKCYHKSIRIAERQSGAYDLALSRLCLTKLLHEQSPDKYSDELAACETSIEQFNDLIQRGLREISGNNPARCSQRA